MRHLILPLILAASTPSWAIDCAMPTTVADASKLLDGAEGSYSDLDVDRFAEALDELSLTLQCLNEPMPTDVAAHVHRMQALKAFIEGADADAQESLRAAKALQPDYAFPDSLLPDNHPLRTEYGRMSGKSTGGERVPPASEGRLSFDGKITNTRPEHATFVQVLDGDGGVTTNRYVMPGHPLPAYAGDDAAVAGSSSTDSGARDPDGPVAPLPGNDGGGVPLLELSGVGIGTVGAVGMLTSYSGAKKFEARSQDPEVALTNDDFDQIEGDYQAARKRTYVFAGIAGAGVAVALVGLTVPISDRVCVQVTPTGALLTVGGLR